MKFVRREKGFPSLIQEHAVAQGKDMNLRRAAHRPAVIFETFAQRPLQLGQLRLERITIDLGEQLCHALTGSLSDSVVVGLCTTHIVRHHLACRIAVMRVHLLPSLAIKA